MGDGGKEKGGERRGGGGKGIEGGKRKTVDGKTL